MACDCNGGDSCNCYIQGGLNVAVSGFGTSREPLTLDVDPAFLEAESTDSVTASLTGTGDTSSPYFLAMSLLPPAGRTYAKRWFGEQDEFDELPYLDPETTYIVSGPTPNIPGVENIYVEEDRAVRVYVGSLMVADDDGGTLGPGT